MDDRPIGVFDSGLGGLTSIPYIMRSLPREAIVYYGDTARAPYGSKTPSIIRKMAAEIADFLVESQNVKLIAIACNTVSAVALDVLRERHPGIPVIGIIEPASLAVSKTCSLENRIGVIGTKATIASGFYPREIHALNPDLMVYQQACPLFVPLIEEGLSQNRIMELTIEYCLDSFIAENDIDTLVLGCTHYSLIHEVIAGLYPTLSIIDSSAEIPGSIAAELSSFDIASDIGAPERTFYASDLSDSFVNTVDLIFSGTDYPKTIRSFNVENFKS